MKSNMAVELRQHAGLLLSTVQNVELARHEVAFYLLENGVRVQARPYQRVDVAVFHVGRGRGKYKVRAFVRNFGSDDAGSVSSSEVELSSAMPRSDLQVRIREAIDGHPHVVSGDYQTQKEVGFLPRPNATPIDLNGSIAWQLSDRNSEFGLHAWRFLNPIWKQMAASVDLKHLTEALSFMRIWWQFVCSGGTAPSLWYDMAVGIRAIHLALVMSLAKRLDLQGEPPLVFLTDMAKEHLSQLRDPKLTARANHGIWQMMGLKYLARAFEGQEDAYADQVMRELVDAAFDENGVNTENSPYYHLYNLQLLRRVPRVLFPTMAAHLDEVDSQGRDVTAWLTAPDGSFYRFGDTEGRGVPMRRPFDDSQDVAAVTFKDLSASGYALVRGHPAHPGSHGFGFAMHIPSSSRAHAHADHLSFILYHKGWEVFADSGKYLYERGDWRDYFKSDCAHSTVGLAGEMILPSQVDLEDGKLDPLSCTGTTVTCAGHVKKGALTHRRTAEVEPGAKLTLEDRMEGANSEIEVRFQLGADIEPSFRPGGADLLRRGQLIAKIEIDPQVVSTSMHQGELQGRHRGWISFEYGKKVPAPLLVLTYPATTRRVVTVITLA